MKHIFDVEIAMKIGINAAIILENIGYWVAKNEANGENFFEGNYWTYNSRQAYQKLFPYLTKKQIDTAFDKLLEEEYIIKGNFNSSAYNRTLWYTLTDKGKCILHFGTMENPEKENRKPTEGKCIYTNINTVINPDINEYTADFTNKFAPSQTAPAVPKVKRFVKPTLEEVKAYCKERKNGIDAHHFIDYYESNGWKVGKNAMKDWKAAVRTWERNGYGNGVKNNAGNDTDSTDRVYDEHGGYDEGGWHFY